MATLILTAVGSALGGPIGGAIGAIAGQAIDGELFKPAPRQGPRLANLAVQTSSYGTAIPKIFGTMRVAGTVAWATDLVESKKTTGGGKGRAATETYSYSASFAVLLSARRIVRVGRIWADGKLLRGAAGDLKVELGALRVHDGNADQSVDPLIAAAEGADAPAWRGTAYTVFEQLQLADYGNRIPSLTFEVIAEEAPVALGSMLSELGGAGVTADAGPLVTGYAASGSSARAVAESIGAVHRLLCRDENGVRLRWEPVACGPVDADDLGARADDTRVARVARNVGPLETAPASVSFAYLDPARDHQAGLQRVRRTGPGQRDERIDLPAALDATAARAIADRALADRALTRRRATVALPWRALTCRPGDRISVMGEPWRIAESRFERMAVNLDLVRYAAAIASPAISDPGRSVAEIDAVHGPTVLRVLDLPPVTDAVASGAIVAVAAAGPSVGWRRASLLASIDNGASYQVAGGTALPATMGTTLTALPNGADGLIDRIASVDVALLNPTMVLGDANALALQSGANLAMIGGEALQFGRAEPLPSGAWRLSELWRGRRGTVPTAHASGTDFTIIDDASLVLLPAPLAVPGVRAMASGLGDTAPYPEASCATVGRATMPLSPVHPKIAVLTSGDTGVTWVRRSRAGWAWPDSVDAALGEEREAYRVHWPSGSTDVSTPTFTYTAAMRALDAAGGATVADIAIRQVGSASLSPPLTVSIDLT